MYENIVQLKMQSSDGKFYNTDVADTEQLLRLIQSVSSKKAEPFKMWLAKDRGVAIEGGTIAGNARKEIEAKTGKK